MRFFSKFWLLLVLVALLGLYALIQLYGDEFWNWATADRSSENLVEKNLQYGIYRVKKIRTGKTQSTLKPPEVKPEYSESRQVLLTVGFKGSDIPLPKEYTIKDRVKYERLSPYTMTLSRGIPQELATRDIFQFDLGRKQYQAGYLMLQQEGALDPLIRCGVVFFGDSIGKFRCERRIGEKYSGDQKSFYAKDSNLKDELIFTSLDLMLKSISSFRLKTPLRIKEKYKFQTTPLNYFSSTSIGDGLFEVLAANSFTRKIRLKNQFSFPKSAYYRFKTERASKPIDFAVTSLTSEASINQFEGTHLPLMTSKEVYSLKKHRVIDASSESEEEEYRGIVQLTVKKIVDEEGATEEEVDGPLANPSPEEETSSEESAPEDLTANN